MKVHQETRTRLVRNAQSVLLRLVRRAIFDSDEDADRAASGIKWLASEAITAYEEADSAYENARYQMERAHKLEEELGRPKYKLPSER